MARQPKDKSLCEFSGCKGKAVWASTKLWGKGGEIRTCADHKPGGRPLPEHLRPARPFYATRPIEEGSRS